MTPRQTICARTLSLYFISVTESPLSCVQCTCSHLLCFKYHCLLYTGISPN